MQCSIALPNLVAAVRASIVPHYYFHEALIEQCSVSPPTQDRLYDTVLHIKRPNQQCQTTEGKDATEVKKTQKKKPTQNTAI